MSFVFETNKSNILYTSMLQPIPTIIPGFTMTVRAAAASLYIMLGAPWVTTSPLARVPPLTADLKGQSPVWNSCGLQPGQVCLRAVTQI